MSQLRTNAILDASGGNTATINTVPLRPGVLDPENRIINGAFDFWQRGTSQTTDNYASADRWLQFFNGGTITMSRQAFALGDTLGSNNPTYFLRQTVSGQSTSGNFAFIAQRIEGVRSYAGQTITLLGWARRSSGSGNMSVYFGQSFGTGGSPSASVDTAAQTVTLTTSWAPFAINFAVPSIAGKTLGSDGNDNLALLIWTSAGSNFNASTNSLGIQTIGVDLWGVHIKVGTHTTAATDLYKQPELGPELARCQRYYEKSYGINTNPATATYIGIKYASGSVAALTTSFLCDGFTYKVRKRAIPSITVYDGNGGSGKVNREHFGVNSYTNQSVTTDNVGDTTALAYSSTGSSAHSISYHWVADAEL
jgi:hypothetical protein